MRILITSVGTATSVNLIKGFHKLDAYIVGVDTNLYGYTAGSMLVNKFYRVVPAVDDAYIGMIGKIIRDEKIDIFIPVNDIEVYEVSKHIGAIQCHCIIPRKDVLELVRDKCECSKQLSQYGIDIPSILIRDNEQCDRILRDRIGVGSKGIKIIPRDKKCPIYSSENKFLQEYIYGEEYTVDVLSDVNGRPMYIIPRKRLEVKSGVATKSYIENNIVLINVVKNILSNIILPGFSNIQFIKDKEGTYRFIEINPRFAGGGAASLAVCDDYLRYFIQTVYHTNVFDGQINKNIVWDAVVTRYYEEIVYENSIH